MKIYLRRRGRELNGSSRFVRGVNSFATSLKANESRLRYLERVGKIQFIVLSRAMTFYAALIHYVQLGWSLVT